MVLLFKKFDHIAGWTLYEVAFCYSVVHMTFSISECFGRGFDAFSIMIRSGTFDRVLVRPRSTILQIFGSKFEFTRIGRLSQSLLVLVIALSHLDINWTFDKGLTFLLMITSGLFVFTGIYILGATLCFWTVEGIEVINVFTDGGREMAQYPLGIYKDWVKKFFTYIIPFGVVNYYPLMFILDKSTTTWYQWTPIYGILFILPCLAIWNFGVKHYKSTGS